MIFTFSHPQYLVLLFAIPLIFFIHFYSLGNKKKKALRFANFDAIAKIEGIDFFSKNIFILLINVLIALSLVFAVSGFTVTFLAKSSSFSYVLAIDSSQSMEAKDLNPDRISAAKQTAVGFIDSAPLGVRIGVVSFSGGSKIEKDMTERKDELRSAVKGIIIGGLGGTDLYEAVLTSTNVLKNENQKSVILISDGQINVGNIDEAIDYANYNNVIVHTIGIGTKEGGSTEYGFSKLDEDSLRSLAYNTNGEYFSAENQESLSNALSSVFAFTEKKVALNLSDYLVIMSLVLLVLEFFLSNTKYMNFP